MSIQLNLQDFAPLSLTDWKGVPELKDHLEAKGMKVSRAFIRDTFKNPPEELKPFITKRGRHFVLHSKAFLCFCLGCSSYPGIDFKELAA